ncbi:MAG TPA: hypothetical protein VHL34_22110 [Rhizomicrobium sp.]|jgi:hypothetical protein|nr:hypothetical protein [Rhizomicrobium sp.]
MDRHPHILNAATNLLGICFVIIGGLKLAHQNTNTHSDELAWVAASFLLSSIVLSYLAIRNGNTRPWQTTFSDWAFLAGIAALVLSMVVAAVEL